MTVVIATPRFMAADRRVTCDGAVSSLVKIAKNRWMIAASSGDAVVTMAITRAVRSGAKTPEDLAKLVNENSYALCLTPLGKIMRIQEGIVWACPPCVEAIGSGADLALGYLGGIADCGYALTMGTVRTAMKFVARRRSDCGGGCDFRSFP